LKDDLDALEMVHPSKEEGKGLKCEGFAFGVGDGDGYGHTVYRSKQGQ
jgi:hypothetical protein